MTHLIKITFTSLSIMMCLKLSAQSGFASCGQSIRTSSGSVSNSVGQVAYLNYSNPEYKINQGIQQPFEIYLGKQVSKRTVDSSASWRTSVFPNPTFADVMLEFTITTGEALRYRLFSSEGRLVSDSELTVSPAVITLRDQDNGVYFLQIFQNDKILKTYKIHKIQ